MFEPLNIVLRVLLALVFLFASTRILTKRSLANLTYFDYIAGTILGTIAGNLAFNIKIDILAFILSMVLMTILIWLISYLTLKNRPLRKFLAGSPTTLIQNGKILEENLTKLEFSYDYLNQALRQEQVFDLNQVEFAILEPNGELSIQLKSQNRPVTPEDLNLTTQYEGLATELILDGEILEGNLQKNSLNEEWLKGELAKRRINSSKDVAFAALSTNGKLYVDLFRDES